MSRRGQAWSIHRDRQGRTTTRLSRRDLRPLSQRRLSAKHGKELDLNRTQEVAGSSPASSISESPAKAGVSSARDPEIDAKVASWSSFGQVAPRGLLVLTGDIPDSSFREHP